MKNYWIILFCLLSLYTQAQQENNIIKAHDSLIESSSSWEKYKLIKNSDLVEYRKSLVSHTDSIERKIKKLEENIQLSNQEINSLQKQNQTLDEELKSLKAEKDNISFLNISMTKSSYLIMVWSIILVLFLILAFVFIKYRNRNIVTQELKENLSNTNKEFEEYKHRAIEKQQKLGRELLDVQKKVQNKNRKNQ